PVRVAGMISHLRSLTTKRGEPMAFGTLEDLDDKVEVVFFPRTWKQCRMDVQVDQVMLLTGKAQLKEDQITVVVDRVDTNLEIAQDADAITGADRPDLDQQAPPNGHVTDSSAPVPVVEPLTAESQHGTPPIPPPPPNFDDSWSSDSAREPATATGMVVVTATESQATPPTNSQSSPKNTESVPQGGNGKTQTVVVEIKPVSNWKETCRNSLREAAKYEGPDTLRLSVPAQGLIMDFPNQHTHVCPDLLEALRLLPGVARVYKS
ncbi:MAG TPA: OB-fold nucleic acid binding domain-containing protein, partial [Anaerolineae bacterium]